MGKRKLVNLRVNLMGTSTTFSMVNGFCKSFFLFQNKAQSTGQWEFENSAFSMFLKITIASSTKDGLLRT